MKKITLLLGMVLLLVTLSACGPDDFTASRGPAPASAPESAAESLIESVPYEVTPQPTAEPDPEIEAAFSLPPEDGWEFDPLVSSPYYSGQAALLEDLQRDSTHLPERFYWIDEETVRSAWGVEEHLSATCQEKVAHFDFSRQSETGAWEEFDLFLTMTPEARLPDFEGYLRYDYTPAGEWEQIDGHPGFELLAVETTRRPLKTHQHIDWAVAVGPDPSADPTAAPTAAPTPAPIPQMVRVRWQIDEFYALLQLPQSGLDAFWENAGQLLVEVDALPNMPRDKEEAQDVASVPASHQIE